MKKQSYKKLSKKRCVDCKQPLKQNLVDKNPKATRCWICHVIKFSKTKNTFLLSWLKGKQEKLKTKYAA